MHHGANGAATSKLGLCGSFKQFLQTYVFNLQVALAGLVVLASCAIATLCGKDPLGACFLQGIRLLQAESMQRSPLFTGQLLTGVDCALSFVMLSVPSPLLWVPVMRPACNITLSTIMTPTLPYPPHPVVLLPPGGATLSPSSLVAAAWGATVALPLVALRAWSWTPSGAQAMPQMEDMHIAQVRGHWWQRCF
jgi:hypothetical protein